MTCEIDFPKILRGLSLYDPSSLVALEGFAQTNPKLCTEFLRTALMSCDAQGDMNVPVQLLTVLFSISREENEKWIVTLWPQLDNQTKRKIAYGAWEINAMSTELALLLFRHESSSVKDRHLIAAGLAASASQRDASVLVLDLLQQIGHYDDPRQQESLRQFIESAKLSFA